MPVNYPFRCLNRQFKKENILFVVVDPRWQVHDVPQSVYVCPSASLPAADRMGVISITQVPARPDHSTYWRIRYDGGMVDKTKIPSPPTPAYI